MTHSFADLRAANLARVPTFRTKSGSLAHPLVEGRPVGFDWSLLDWTMALLGEVGELANALKKLRRGDTPLLDVREALADECVDVLTYLDLVAYRHGFSLDEALRRSLVPNPTSPVTFEDVSAYPASSEPISTSLWMMHLGSTVGGLCRMAMSAPRHDRMTQNLVAETCVYLFGLATSLDIDMVEATIRKWNAVSVRVGSPVRLWVEPEPADPG